MSDPTSTAVSVGDAIPPLVRTTDSRWNRYAAVNDEFIPIHMDHAARAGWSASPPRSAWGTCGSRTCDDARRRGWLGDAGDIVEFACQFRGLNFKGDTLTASATVTGKEVRDGASLVHLALSVTNRDGVDTTPGTATVRFFDGARRAPRAQPAAPSRTAANRRAPHPVGDRPDRDATREPITGWPVGANDIRHWAIATHWPEPPPARFVDTAVAADGPWVAWSRPRDLDPFAWNPRRPWGGPWLRGMGSEPGRRILNGGQRSAYLRPDPPRRRGHRRSAGSSTSSRRT